MGNCCAQPPDVERLVDASMPMSSTGGASSQRRVGQEAAASDRAPVATDELPAGWRAVPSRSRPGKIAYQNIFTGERISWMPTEAASHTKGEIKKKKKKKKKKKARAKSTGGEEGKGEEALLSVKDDGETRSGEGVAAVPNPTVESKGAEGDDDDNEE